MNEQTEIKPLTPDTIIATPPAMGNENGQTRVTPAEIDPLDEPRARLAHLETICTKVRSENRVLTDNALQGSGPALNFLCDEAQNLAGAKFSKVETSKVMTVRLLCMRATLQVIPVIEAHLRPVCSDPVSLTSEIAEAVGYDLSPLFDDALSAGATLGVSDVFAEVIEQKKMREQGMPRVIGQFEHLATNMPR